MHVTQPDANLYGCLTSREASPPLQGPISLAPDHYPIDYRTEDCEDNRHHLRRHHRRHHGHALARRGFLVTLYERHRYAAMETSYANGGQLSACHAEVWNHGATLIKGLKWMLRPDAPLLLDPKPSWHKLSWLAGFIAAIPHYRQNTQALARLAIAARAPLQAWAEAEAIQFDLRREGILHIYRGRKEFERAAEVSKLLAAAGLERRAVTPEEMRAIEPALQGNFYGGYFTESDASGDIHLFTQGLVAALSRYGAPCHFGAQVQRLIPQGGRVRVLASLAPRSHSTLGRGTGPERDTNPVAGHQPGQASASPAGAGTGPDPGLPSDRRGDRNVSDATDALFDAVVICAGTASRALAARLGDRINIYPVKGYSISLHLGDEASRAAAPKVSLLDDEVKLVSSRLGEDRLRVAGTAEFNGFNRDIRADRIRPLIEWVEANFPAVCTREVTPWAGLRPMTPDLQPRVGPSRIPAIFYNTGHGHLGWTLSAATAEQVAVTVARYLGS